MSENKGDTVRNSEDESTENKNESNRKSSVIEWQSDDDLIESLLNDEQHQNAVDELLQDENKISKKKSKEGPNYRRWGKKRLSLTLRKLSLSSQSRKKTENIEKQLVNLQGSVDNLKKENSLLQQSMEEIVKDKRKISKTRKQSDHDKETYKDSTTSSSHEEDDKDEYSQANYDDDDADRRSDTKKLSLPREQAEIDFHKDDVQIIYMKEKHAKQLVSSQGSVDNMEKENCLLFHGFGEQSKEEMVKDKRKISKKKFDKENYEDSTTSSSHEEDDKDVYSQAYYRRSDTKKLSLPREQGETDIHKDDAQIVDMQDKHENSEKDDLKKENSLLFHGFGNHSEQSKEGTLKNKRKKSKKSDKERYSDSMSSFSYEKDDNAEYSRSYHRRWSLSLSKKQADIGIQKDDVEMQEKHENYEKQLMSLQGRVDDLRKENSLLEQNKEKTVKDLQKVIAEKSNALNQSEKKRMDLDQRLHGLCNDLEMSRSEVNVLFKDKETLKTEIEDKTTELLQCSGSRDIMETSALETSEYVLETEMALSQQQRFNADLNTDLAQEKKTVVQLKRDLINKEHECQQYKSMLVESKQRCSMTVASYLKQLTEVINEQRKTASPSKKKGKSQVITHDQLNLREEKNRIAEQVELLSTENIALEMHLDDLKKQLGDVTKVLSLYETLGVQLKLNNIRPDTLNSEGQRLLAYYRAHVGSEKASDFYGKRMTDSPSYWKESISRLQQAANDPDAIVRKIKSPGKYINPDSKTSPAKMKSRPKDKKKDASSDKAKSPKARSQVKSKNERHRLPSSDENKTANNAVTATERGELPLHEVLSSKDILHHKQGRATVSECQSYPSVYPMPHSKQKIRQTTEEPSNRHSEPHSKQTSDCNLLPRSVSDNGPAFNL